MLAQWRGVAEVLPIRTGGRGISYLPLGAHRRPVGHRTTRRCSSAPRSRRVADPRQVAAALPEVRPTSWGAVPRVAEKLKAAIEAQIAADPDEARRDGDAGRDRDRDRAHARSRSRASAVPAELKAGTPPPRSSCCAPLREKLGLDEADWVMFGAAPLPLDVHEFIRGLGIPTVEVYGMSESAMIATIYPPDEARLGTVGRPIPGVELRLAEDGEVLLRGATVMRGYRDDPEKTAEAIDADGWLHTGDVGELDDDGYLRIVDRKKELIINAAGKNMSPANIESQLKSASPADRPGGRRSATRRPYNVALLVLDPDAPRAPRPPTTPERARGRGRAPRVERGQRAALARRADQALRRCSPTSGCPAATS